MQAANRGGIVVEDIILSIGSASFGRTLFEVLNDEFTIRQIVVHRFVNDGAQALAVERADGIRQVPREVDQYLRSLYRRDPNRALLSPSPARRIHVSNVDAARIRDREYRQSLFASAGFAGKLSLIVRLPDQALAVTMYRDEGVGAFSEVDCKKLEAFQGCLLAAVQRHFVHACDDRASLIEKLKDALFAFSGPKRLSEREALVCAYVLLGYSNEAIRLNLQLSFHSIVTYRRRAYSKLAVTSQNELFAMVLRALDRTHFAQPADVSHIAATDVVPTSQ